QFGRRPDGRVPRGRPRGKRRQGDRDDHSQLRRALSVDGAVRGAVAARRALEASQPVNRESVSLRADMSEPAARLEEDAPAAGLRARQALLKRLADVVSLPSSRVNAFERAVTGDLLV